jgi:hypothetical protein
VAVVESVAGDPGGAVQRFLDGGGWKQKAPEDVLGLNYGATKAAVKLRYRKLVLRVHPDKCRHALAVSVDPLSRQAVLCSRWHWPARQRSVVVAARQLWHVGCAGVFCFFC